MAWQLSTLPSSIIGHILNGTGYSFLVLNLWKCGNRSLNSNLSQGVLEVHLKHPSFHKLRVQESPRSLYPRILSNLHSLRSLSIKTKVGLMRSSYDWQLELYKLPATLETLIIHSSDAVTALINFEADSPGCIITQYPRGHSRFWNISSFWPRLHTLEIIDERATFDPLDLAALPDSLTCLTSGSSGREQFMHVLPRNLIKLNMNIEERLLDFNRAPLSLEYISSVNATSMQSDAPPFVKSIASWPSSVHLGTLRLSTWSSAYSAALSHVDILYLQGRNGKPLADSENWVAELPRSLRQLHLVCMMQPLGPFFAHVPNLPPGLTKLDINANSSTDYCDLESFIEKSGGTAKYWPSSLLFFALCLSTGPTPAHFDLLPPSLTSLRINHVASERDFEDNSAVIDTSKFPRGLTACALQYRSSDNPQIFFKGSMPTSLKVLDFTPPSVFDGASLVTTFSTESSPIVQFNLSSTLLINEPLVLPSQISALILEQWRFDWFEAVPKSVTRLSVSNISRSASEGNQVDLFAALPSSLTRLDLDVPRMKEPLEILFAPSSLSTLANLQHLVITNKVGRFQSAVFRLLSPKLNTLEMDLDTFDPLDVPFFPPNIIEGTLSGQSVAWAEVKPLLPSHIRVLANLFGPSLNGGPKKPLGAPPTSGSAKGFGFGAAPPPGPSKQQFGFGASPPPGPSKRSSAAADKAEPAPEPAPAKRASRRR